MQGENECMDMRGERCIMNEQHVYSEENADWSRLKVHLAELEGRQAMVGVFLYGPVDKVAVRRQNRRVEM